MPRGGQRKGAGRPKGTSSLLTKELREKINAEALIKFLQRLADGKVNGARISDRKEAAVALLKKVLPDIRQLKAEIEQPHFEPVKFYYSCEHCGGDPSDSNS